MTFLPITTDDARSEAARVAANRHVELYGDDITTVQATLLSHVPSFTAYEEWYTLRDELVPFIGERAVSLFSYAISDENDSLVCSVHFRRILIESGEDPENPQVTEAEQLLIDWGRVLVSNPAGISDEFYARLERAFNPQLRVLLLAFAGHMVATNLFTSAGRIPLDEELYAFRKPGDTRTR